MLSEEQKEIDHDLFRSTKQYHADRLEELFLRYYKPKCNGEVNNFWTIHVPKSVMTKCRLHLSWVLDLNVLHMMDEKKIGKLVLKRYKTMNKLSEISDEIRQYELIMNIYGDVDLDKP